MVRPRLPCRILARCWHISDKTDGAGRFYGRTSGTRGTVEEPSSSSKTNPPLPLTGPSASALYALPNQNSDFDERIRICSKSHEA